ncbi:hypothetical protein CH375_19360 [Leptospira ellisii]|nr:hypothetical protein CH375_19360 [Leptospira ellisii]
MTSKIESNILRTPTFPLRKPERKGRFFTETALSHIRRSERIRRPKTFQTNPTSGSFLRNLPVFWKGYRIEDVGDRFPEKSG